VLLRCSPLAPRLRTPPFRWTEEEHRRAKNRAANQPLAYHVLAGGGGASEARGSGRAASGGSVRAPDAKELVAFRAAVAALRRAAAAAEARVGQCERRCWGLEDVLACQQRAASGSSDAAAALRSPLLDTYGHDGGGDGGVDGGGGGGAAAATIEWWDGSVSGAWGVAWHAVWRPRLTRLASALLALGSVFVLAAELAALVDAATARSAHSGGALVGLGASALGPGGCAVAVGLALLHAATTLAWATCKFAGTTQPFTATPDSLFLDLCR
jgi:hypothetical protein